MTDKKYGPVISAILDDNLEKLRESLDKGGDPNEVDSEGKPALYHAVMSGWEECRSIETIDYLLDHGADPKPIIEKYNDSYPFDKFFKETLPAIRELIYHRVDLMGGNKDNQCSALIDAARQGYINVIKLLIGLGADMNAQDEEGNTALHEAARWQSVKTVRFLIANGANPNIKDKEGFTPLIIAALMEDEQANRTPVIKCLIESGADVNASDNEGETALMFAVQDGCLEAVRLLIEAGCDVNQRDKNDYISLHHAVAYEDYPDVIEILLKAGADPMAQMEYGYTPWEASIRSRIRPNAEFPFTAAILRKAMRDRGIKPDREALAKREEATEEEELNQEAAVIRAVKKNDIALLKQILSDGSDYKEDCSIVLEYAAQNRSLEFVQCLLDHGADPNREGWNGYRPIRSAARRNHILIMEALVKAGADVNAPSNRGEKYAIMSAARYGSLEAVRFLIRQGSDVSKRNSMRHTALHYAMKGWGDYPKVVKELLKAGADPLVRIDSSDSPLEYSLLDKNAIPVLRPLSEEILRQAMKEKGALPEVYQLTGKREEEARRSKQLLIMAILFRDVEKLQQALEAGADPNEKDPKRFSCNRYALNYATYRSLDLVQPLLDHGADPNIADEESGERPLISAARRNDVPMMQALLKAGADIHATMVNSQYGFTVKHGFKDAMAVAAQSGSLEAMRFLISQGCDIHRQDKYGYAALHHAVMGMEDHPEIVKELLALGADPFLRTRWDDTALDVSVEIDTDNGLGHPLSEAILRKAMGIKDQ